MTTWIIHHKKINTIESEQIKKHCSSHSGEHTESQLLESNGKISRLAFHQKYTLNEYRKCPKRFGLFHQKTSTGHRRSYVVLVDLELKNDEACLQFNEKVKGTPLQKHQFNLTNNEHIKHMVMNKMDAMCLVSILNQMNTFPQEVTEMLVDFFCKDKAIADAFALRQSIYSGATLIKSLDLFDASNIREISGDFPMRTKYRR